MPLHIPHWWRWWWVRYVWADGHNMMESWKELKLNDQANWHNIDRVIHATHSWNVYDWLDHLFKVNTLTGTFSMNTTPIPFFYAFGFPHSVLFMSIFCVLSIYSRLCVCSFLDGRACITNSINLVHLMLLWQTLFMCPQKIRTHQIFVNQPREKQWKYACFNLNIEIKPTHTAHTPTYKLFPRLWSLLLRYISNNVQHIHKYILSVIESVDCGSENCLEPSNTWVRS